LVNFTLDDESKIFREKIDKILVIFLAEKVQV